MMTMMSPSKKKKIQSNNDDSFSEEYDRCDEFGSKYALRNKGTHCFETHLNAIYIVI